MKCSVGSAEKTKESLLAKLTVRVIPRASRTEIVSYIDGILKIRLKAPPVDGAANDELIRLLSKLFKVHRTSVEIKYGASSRNKVVAINGLTQSDSEVFLSRYKQGEAKVYEDKNDRR
jgi:uncharacterized protein (TIGR00251 family)